MTSIFGLFDTPELFQNQNYNQLKKKCLENHELFEDPQFTPTLDSLFQSLDNDDNEAIEFSTEIKEIKWKRPHEIVNNPYLFVNGVTSNDVLQGRLGNCWFVAACACITVYRENWMMLIPDYKGQEWPVPSEDNSSPDKSNYCGIFRFRFWRYGHWVEVVIDDLLPTLNDELIYCHSNYRNEFWSALLEKSYAKLLGSYESLEGGELMDSLLDFTGGVIEPMSILKHYRDPRKVDELFNYLLKSHGSKALIACAIPAKTQEEQEAETSEGLIIGHAYSIIGVTEIVINPNTVSNSLPNHISTRIHNDNDNENKIRILRLRNPWGQQEWRGCLCDGSQDWSFVTRTSKHRINLSFRDDGEFWIPMYDFLDNFKTLLICHQIQFITVNSSSLSSMYTETIFHGEWTIGCAGGCLNYMETFLNNPQYIFDINDSTRNEVMISLTQKSIRSINRLSGSTGLLHIGFSVFRTEYNRYTKVMNLNHLILVKSSAFKNGRSVFERFKLSRGRYLLIPCTFNNDEYGQFLLRIYCPSSINAHELSKMDSVTTNSYLQSLSSLSLSKDADTVVSRLTLLKAYNLPRLDPINGGNPYVLLMCEKQRAVSSVKSKTLNPNWSESFLFYRQNFKNEPIYILVYSKSGVLDEFMGRQVIKYASKNNNEVIELRLLDRASSATCESVRPSLRSLSSKMSKKLSTDQSAPLVYLQHTFVKLADINNL